MKVDKKYKKKYSKFSVLVITPVHKHTKHNTIFINESGLYEILSNSNKELAIIFKEAGDKNLKKIFNPHASSQDLFKNL
jgi:hypothetical protein